MKTEKEQKMTYSIIETIRQQERLATISEFKEKLEELRVKAEIGSKGQYKRGMIKVIEELNKTAQEIK